MKAVVLLKIASIDVQETCRLLRELPAVSSACQVFGRYDALALVQADDLEQMRAILVKQIQPLPGVLETLPCLIVDETCRVELAGITRSEL